MAKIWEERRPGYHSYFKEGERSVMYGDVRATIIDPNAPVKYEGLVYSPMPRGTKVGIFDTLDEAKVAVEQECIVRSL